MEMIAKQVLDNSSSSNSSGSCSDSSGGGVAAADEKVSCKGQAAQFPVGRSVRTQSWSGQKVGRMEMIEISCINVKQSIR